MSGISKSFVMALLLIVSMLLGDGCNRRESASNAGQAHRPVIGVSYPGPDHNWTAGLEYWVRQTKALHPEVDWITEASANPQDQVASIRSMMARGVDGLVVLATESAPVTPVAKEAHDRGIFLVSVDRGLTQPVADVYLEGDNKAFGRKSAEFMVSKLGGNGNIVILQGIPSNIDTDRVQGAMQVFHANPGIKILGMQPGNWNRTDALHRMQDFLTRFPKIDAVWASDDDMALGAIQAIQDQKRDKEMWVLGGAGMKDIIKRVMDHDPMIPADITYPPSMIGLGMHTAASALRDGKPAVVKSFTPRHLVLDVDLVTPENAKDFYFPDASY